jgi:RNA polymerase sigma factor (sigma-70 family)
MTTTTIATMSMLAIFQSNAAMPCTHAFTTTPQPSPSTNSLRTSNTLLAAVGNPSNFFEQTTKSNKTLHRLTHQQEVSYLQQMKSYPSDSTLSQRARETLLLHNLPLVQSIVTKVLRSRPHLQQGNTGSPSESKVGAALTRDDLLHEGTIGLAEALDRYDLAFAYTEPNQQSVTDKAFPNGARLGTYATYWIRARIVRAIQSREHLIRFPERVLQANHRLVKAAADLGMEWNDVVEMAEAAADSSSLSSNRQQQRDALQQAAGITSEFLFREAVRVRSMSASGSHTPFEAWMSADQQEEDGLEEEEEASPERIRETLSKFLKPREVEVLSLRYGLISADEDDEEVAATGVENANAVASSSPQLVFRDYEAEAEEDLFGPNGILSHYSAVPSKASSVSASAAAAATSKKTTQETYLSVRSQSATSAPALLPFKEIGKKMKFSGEYCRRTCSAALNKLTRAAEEGRLAESDFLLGW